jgi:hypothetical protein
LGSVHDKSVGNYALAPPRLFPMRIGIHLQYGRAVLVRRGSCPPADADRWRGLPVPRLSAQGGGTGVRKPAAIAIIKNGSDSRRHCERSEAIHGTGKQESIASSLSLLAMTAARAFARRVGS